MSDADRDHVQAVECLLRAVRANNRAEQQNWLALADGWLTLCSLEQRAEQELRTAKHEVHALVRKERDVTPQSDKSTRILEWATL
jgi:hypothetical protein